MSDKEKKIIETIAKAVPKMSDFQKGYLLGVGETMVDTKKEDEQHNDEEAETA